MMSLENNSVEIDRMGIFPADPDIKVDSIFSYTDSDGEVFKFKTAPTANYFKDFFEFYIEKNEITDIYVGWNPSHYMYKSDNTLNDALKDRGKIAYLTLNELSFANCFQEH